MHEYSVVQGILDAVVPAAEQAGATRILKVRLRIGDMTEVVRESLDFMWEIACEDRGALTLGCLLEVEYVHPRSLCVECGSDFVHDRFHLACPQCVSTRTRLMNGRELEVADMDVDVPDDVDESPKGE